MFLVRIYLGGEDLQTELQSDVSGGNIMSPSFFVGKKAAHFDYAAVQTKATDNLKGPLGTTGHQVNTLGWHVF